MKKIVFLLVIMTSYVFSSSVNWINDYESALVQSKELNKPILMLVDSKYCPYCQILKEDIKNNPSTSQFINENFIPVLVRMNSGTYPSDIFEVYGTPTTFFINSEAKAYTTPIVGYVKKDKYLKYLHIGLKNYK